MITYKLHLIRHGMTLGNAEHLLVGGRTDMPLCPEGMEELRNLSETYAYPAVGKLYCSPLLRALQTAETLYPEMEPRLVEGLRECDLGEFDGLSMAQLKGNEQYLGWVEGKNAPPGGESSQALAERIVSAFEEILDDMMKTKVQSAAVVSHGLVMMGLLALCGYPKRELRLWATANGRGYTVRTSAAMWMRDRCFEVVDTVPAGSPASGGFFDDGGPSEHDTMFSSDGE